VSLTVTVLGCAGSYPEPGNACSGYLVRSPGGTVVVDFGSGSLANLQRHVELGQIDALVLTHEHPDHWLDLPILRNAMRYYLGLEGLAVYGTSGVHEQAQAIQSDLAPTLKWTTLGGASQVQVGDQSLTFSVTDHPVETVAVRVAAAGRTFVYSADTGSGWAREGFVDGADLLLCEATLAEEHEDELQHLSGRQAGALAREAGVGQLVLTHIAPILDPEVQRSAAEAAFGGPVDLAVVHQTFVV
jgi:ribonuclease BN (tRNA processing enzyme)